MYKHCRVTKIIMAADSLFACVAFFNDCVVQVMVQRPPSNID